MKQFTVFNPDETTTEWVEISLSDNDFVSMPKAVWDALNADSEGNK